MACVPQGFCDVSYKQLTVVSPHFWRLVCLVELWHHWGPSRCGGMEILLEYLGRRILVSPDREALRPCDWRGPGVPAAVLPRGFVTNLTT